MPVKHPSDVSHQEEVQRIGLCSTQKIVLMWFVDILNQIAMLKEEVSILKKEKQAIQKILNSVLAGGVQEKTEEYCYNKC